MGVAIATLGSAGRQIDNFHILRGSGWASQRRSQLVEALADQVAAGDLGPQAARNRVGAGDLAVGADCDHAIADMLGDHLKVALLVGEQIKRIVTRALGGTLALLGLRLGSFAPAQLLE